MKKNFKRMLSFFYLIVAQLYFGVTSELREAQGAETEWLTLGSLQRAFQGARKELVLEDLDISKIWTCFDYVLSPAGILRSRPKLKYKFIEVQGLILNMIPDSIYSDNTTFQLESQQFRALSWNWFFKLSSEKVGSQTVHYHRLDHFRVDTEGDLLIESIDFPPMNDLQVSSISQTEFKASSYRHCPKTRLILK